MNCAWGFVTPNSTVLPWIPDPTQRPPDINKPSSFSIFDVQVAGASAPYMGFVVRVLDPGNRILGTLAFTNNNLPAYRLDKPALGNNYDSDEDICSNCTLRRLREEISQC
jgi:hypothetical protein